jgi:Domain of unknown function (DUF4270)
VNRGLFTSFIISFCLFLTACEDPQEIGSEVFVQDVGVLYTDTLTVDASTILLDSIVTNNTDNLLVGRYTDPILGLVEASSYFQISNKDTIRTELFESDKITKLDITTKKDFKWIKNPTKVDSIRFLLPYTFYQGDTLQKQTFTLTQLDDNALLDPTKTYFRTDNPPLLKSTVFGQLKNVSIKPVRNKNIIGGSARFDTLRIPVTDPAFINFIISQRESTNKENALIGTGFKSKIRGLALTSESVKNAAILGISPYNSVMKVYYSYTYSYTLRNKANTSDSIKVTVDSTKSNDFYIGRYINSSTGAPLNARFNKITTSRSGAFSKLVNPTDILTATQASNQVVLQSSTGLGTKIKFASLLKLKERQDIAINKAELVLEPNPSIYSVPNDLVLIESTPTNRLLRNTLTSEGALQFVAGEASIASYVAKTNNYTFNVTSSLQNILSGRNKTNGWILTADTFREATQTSARGPVSGKYIVSTEVDRAVFDSKKIKLKVYYTYIGK